MQMKFCSCLSSRGELFKAGFSAKFEFRSEGLKSKFSLTFFVCNLIIGCSKNENRKLSNKSTFD